MQRKQALSKNLLLTSLVCLPILLTGVPSLLKVNKVGRDSSDSITLTLPVGKIAEAVYSPYCAEQVLKTYDVNPQNYKSVNSGLTVFSRRLAKEVNENIDLFTSTIIGELNLNTNQNSTCLPFLKLIVDQKLKEQNVSKDIKEIALRADESVYCSASKAFFSQDRVNFFEADKVISDYSAKLSGKRFVAKLRKQLSDLQKRKVRSKAAKKTHEIRIRALKFSIKHHSFFQNDSLNLVKLFDAVCSRLAQKSLPVQPTQVSVPTPQVYITATSKPETIKPTAIVSPSQSPGSREPVASRFKKGDRIVVFRNTNIRQAAGLSQQLLGVQLTGSAGTIVSDNPALADGYVWWSVNFDTGADGFCGEDNFNLYSVTPTAVNTANPVATATPVVSRTATSAPTLRPAPISSPVFTPGTSRVHCVNQSQAGCFSTINACLAQAISGDICSVSAGNYSEIIKTNIASNPLAPVIVRPAVRSAEVLIDGLDLDDAHFVHIEGLKFKSLTRDRITWEFDRHYLAGTYVNGDPWVKGPVTISRFGQMPEETFTWNVHRPCTVVGSSVAVPGLSGLYNCAYVGQWKTSTASTTIVPSTTSQQGGSMSDFNPALAVVQGLSLGSSTNQFHTSIPYDSNLNLALKLPININVSSSVPVSSLLSTASPGTSKPRFSHNAVLTVVHNLPAQGEFRPYYGGPVKPFRSLNINNINWGLLKSLAVPSGAGLPNQNDLMNRMKRLIIEKDGGWDGETGTQFKVWSHNYLMTYGREIAYVTSDAAMSLHSNLSNQDKSKLIAYLVQYGLDILGALENGMQFKANGGHNQGRLLPAYIAVRLLNIDNNYLTRHVGDFQEIMQHGYVQYNSRTIPEWTSSAIVQYTAWNASGYRPNNGGPGSAAVLSMLLIEGSRDQLKIRLGNSVNVRAWIDYIIDVFYPIETGRPKVDIRTETPVQGVGNATNKIKILTKAMWDTYLSNP